MISLVALQKVHPDLPDYYSISIIYVNGKSEEIKAAEHRLIDNVYNNKIFVGVMPIPFFEIWTKENEMIVIPISSIISMKFDKDFSKIIEIKNKMEAKKDDKDGREAVNEN